jgi:predicted nucleotidyltransferase
MGLADRFLADLRPVFRRRPEVRLAIAFGSRARGRESPRSDLDVAIEGEGIDLLDLGRDLGEAARLEVHAVDLTRAGYPLLKALLRDGIIVHEGVPHAAATWRTRAILQTETDRPWFERMRDAFLQRTAERVDG